MPNELGAGKPKAAKRSIMANFVKAGVLGVVFAIITVAAKNQLPAIFTEKLEVEAEFLDGISIINIGCYNVVGLPIGALLSYKFKLGIWNALLVEERINYMGMAQRSPKKVPN
ncbi:protein DETOXIFICATION 34-like [Coffea arabica]|uniref:Protein DETOXIFICATION 34-like n=1 Tax=Coffea arabica TaxID=13443 RepID=A0ABM4WP07_COFAR